VDNTEYDLLGHEAIGTRRREGKGNAIARLQSIAWLGRAAVGLSKPASNKLLRPRACETFHVQCKELVQTLIFILDGGAKRVRPDRFMVHGRESHSFRRRSSPDLSRSAPPSPFLQGRSPSRGASLPYRAFSFRRKRALFPPSASAGRGTLPLPRTPTQS
jgi:hypothetical protein